MNTKCISLQKTILVSYIVLNFATSLSVLQLVGMSMSLYYTKYDVGQQPLTNDTLMLDGEWVPWLTVNKDKPHCSILFTYLPDPFVCSKCIANESFNHNAKDLT